VAAAGHRLGFAAVGIIRGEERLPLNPVLDFAVSRGMTIAYLGRTFWTAAPSVRGVFPDSGRRQLRRSRGGLTVGKRAVGFSALKGSAFLGDEVRR